MPEELGDALSVLREGQDFEVKEAQGQHGQGDLPKSFWPTYSAFANSSGGRVLLGAREKHDGSLDILGIVRPEPVLKELWDGLNNPQQASVNLLSPGQVQVVPAAGKQVILIHVPRADRTQRPVFIGGNPLTGTFRRGHEGDYHCSEEQVKRLLADASQRPSDGEVLPHYGLDDLDPESLSAYRNLFRSTSPGHPFLAGDDREFLRQLGGWRTDRDSGVEGLTLAGLLMFGRQRPLLDRLPYFQLDYQQLPPEHQAGAPRWLDRVTIDGTWAGNVFEFYRRIWPRLKDGLQVPFRLGPDLQRLDETPQHEALREALINTLIHADHSGRGGIRIRRRTSGFEFLNPGDLRLPLEQVQAGGRSDCRNPSLQIMFQMLGWGEKAGSGYPKIRQAWQAQHWRAPSLEVDPELNETRLRLTTESLLPAEVMADLERRFPGRLATIGEMGRIALATASIEGAVTNRRLQDLSDRHARDLTTLLQSLCEEGFMSKSGRTTGTVYTVVNVPNISLTEPSSGANNLSSGANNPSSGANNPSSSTEDSDPVLAICRSIRARPGLVRTAIVALCRTGYQRPEDLAASLKRKAEGLRKRYLTAMVREGVLEQLYPDPTDPRQAYRTKNQGPGFPNIVSSNPYR